MPPDPSQGFILYLEQGQPDTANEGSTQNSVPSRVNTLEGQTYKFPTFAISGGLGMMTRGTGKVD